MPHSQIPVTGHLQVFRSFASEWIQKMVILEAKSLLGNKNFSVQQISDMMNFPNPSFFGKYFKAATGMTPRKYRMQ